MRKAILAILLTMIILPFVSATITVSDVNVACSPVNPATGNCFQSSTFIIRYLVNDDNVVSASADGNTFNWFLTVGYGINGECGLGVGGNAATPNDSNIVKPTICAADNWGSDSNFNLSRSCLTTVTIPTITNGNYCFDLNVATYTGATFVLSNSDDNESVNFTVDNALASASTRSILDIIPLALVAAAIIILVGALVVVRQGASILPMLPGLIILLVSLIVIALLLAIFAGT